MLKVEARTLGVDLSEKTYESVGPIDQVVQDLHPEAASLPVGDVLTAMLDEIRAQGLCAPSLFTPYPAIFLTGSVAKRVLGGTPKNWDDPRRMWRRIAQDDPEIFGNSVVESLIHGGTEDTDIRLVLKRGASFDDLGQVIRSALQGYPNVTISAKHHGTSRQLRVGINRYVIDVGPLPDYNRTDAPVYVQFQDDLRTSYYALPWRVFAPLCIITDQNDVAVDPQNKVGFWYAAYSVVSSIAKSGIDGAVGGWLRARMTDLFWPPTQSAKRAVSWYDAYTEFGFWDEARRTSRYRDARLADRAPGIATDVLLCLTLDPGVGSAMRRDGILDQLGLGRRWDGEGSFDPTGLARHLNM